MNLIKRIINKSRKKYEENELRKEIRRRFPDLEAEDEEEMIKIARETRDIDLDALREELIRRKLEREKKAKGFEENVINSQIIFYEKRKEIDNADTSEEELEERVPHTIRSSAPAPDEKSQEDSYKGEKITENIDPELVRNSWNIFQRELQEIENMDIPEEEKRILRKIAYRDHLVRIGIEKEIYPIERERFEKLKRIIKWPIHKIEPEENRVSRAIAWGKRRLDHIARTKNREIVLKHKKNKMKEYADTIRIKEAKDSVDRLRKEIKKLEEELKKERERVIRGRSEIRVLDIIERDIERKMKELEDAERKYIDLKNKLDSFIRENAEESIVLKELLRAECYNVLEEIKRRYRIRDEKNILIIRDSLLKFADAEAEKMIQDNYKTIYQSAKGFFLSEFYTPVKDTSKFLYLFTSSIYQFILNFLFSPILIGIIILWLLFSIFLNYIITGPVLAVLIITMIITILVSLGRFWKVFYEIEA